MEAPVAENDAELQRKKKKQAKQALKAAKVAKAHAKQQKQLQQSAEAPEKGEKILRLKQSTNTVLETGEKKCFDECPLDMKSSYNPSVVESGWYSWWEKSGIFSPDRINKDSSRIFSMVIPPPNVTGSLHLGHALTNSIQDTLARYHRMCGYRVLWVPGTDHAGIATQMVVEKRIYREQGKTRRDFSRENFVNRIFDWKEEYKAQITSQLRRMGSSLDWSREWFTMDASMNDAVVEAFVRLHEKKVIYRGTRLVNWSCRLQTAISDIEVESVQLDAPKKIQVPGYKDPVTFGYIWDIKYEVLQEDGGGSIIVSTTRPETLLGDVAVAVHPEDVRYQHLHGKRLKHPFIQNRILSVIADSEFVDPEFGTGAVKITPAHDPNDYRFGKKHGLPNINILNVDGTINDIGGDKFSGLPRYEARRRILRELELLGLLSGRRDHQMVLGKCSRSGDIIEYLLVPQWWIKCERMAENALNIVNNGQIEIIPATFKSNWRAWLSNCQDWCISRQLWWGHRIPAWLVHLDGVKQTNSENVDDWIIARNETEAYALARAKYPECQNIELKQDDDVLDTWFSSGLVAFSSLGWPKLDAEDFKTFFPTSILETGHDILFFWVARMVMLSLELLGVVPFKSIVLHAMVRDSHGRKMSKSLGNVVDPVSVIEGITQESLIAQLRSGNLDSKEIEKATAGIKKDFPRGICECGTDALRFTLLSYTQQCRDINLDVQRIEANRNFCNKIWNATKLTFAFLGYLQQKDDEHRESVVRFVPSRTDAPFQSVGSKMTFESKLNRWILSRLNLAIKSCHSQIKSYNFSSACTTLHSLILYDFCDFYLEAIKTIFYDNSNQNLDAIEFTRQTIYTCLEQIYLLLHPFMPFLTEDLWQRMERRPDHDDVLYPSISVYPYPEPNESLIDEALELEVSEISEIVHAIRSMHVTYKTNKNHPPLFVISPSNSAPDLVQSLLQWKSTIERLSFTKQIEILEQLPERCAVSIPNDTYRIGMVVENSEYFQDAITHLQSEIQNMKIQKTSLDETTSTVEFSKMPKHVQEKTYSKLTSIVNKLQVSDAALQNLKGLCEL